MKETCKDCIHYGICLWTQVELTKHKVCKDFKNKAEFEELTILCDMQDKIMLEQKAEIERLKAEADMTEGYAEALEQKARKEFAERLKKKANSRSYCTIWVSDVDNLLKEMEGED